MIALKIRIYYATDIPILFALRCRGKCIQSSIHILACYFNESYFWRAEFMKKREQFDKTGKIQVKKTKTFGSFISSLEENYSVSSEWECIWPFGLTLMFFHSPRFSILFTFFSCSVWYCGSLMNITTMH